MEVLGPLIIAAGVALAFAIAYRSASHLLYILKVRRRRKLWSTLAAASIALAGLFAVSALWFMDSTSAPNRTHGIPPDIESSAEAAAPRVTASRIFSGPDQYPPKEFAAYGILAFRARATPLDWPRHKMICEAYLATLPHASELRLPVSLQMVTVWPTDSDPVADALNAGASRRELYGDDICEWAIRRYGFVTALQALKDAEFAGADVFAAGPFLLAWSPANSKGMRDALILVADLSQVTTYEQVQNFLVQWAHDIEQNPELWGNGWDIEKLRIAIRLWADKYGPKVLALFGTKE